LPLLRHSADDRLPAPSQQGFATPMVTGPPRSPRPERRKHWDAVSQAAAWPLPGAASRDRMSAPARWHRHRRFARAGRGRQRQPEAIC